MILNNQGLETRWKRNLKVWKTRYQESPSKKTIPKRQKKCCVSLNPLILKTTKIWWSSCTTKSAMKHWKKKIDLIQTQSNSCTQTSATTALWSLRASKIRFLAGGGSWTLFKWIPNTNEYRTISVSLMKENGKISRNKKGNKVGRTVLSMLKTQKRKNQLICFVRFSRIRTLKYKKWLAWNWQDIR